MTDRIGCRICSLYVVHICPHIGILRVLKHLLDLVALETGFSAENLGHRILQKMSHLHCPPQFPSSSTTEAMFNLS